jgi:hypothetical protein
VSSEILRDPLRTYDTVLGATPARSATSLIVVISTSTRPVSGPVGFVESIESIR